MQSTRSARLVLGLTLAVVFPQSGSFVRAQAPTSSPAPLKSEPAALMPADRAAQTAPAPAPETTPADAGGLTTILKSGDKTITAGWDNGFFVRSEDKAFLLRITGQIQADYRTFPTSADTMDTDTFLLRRARLGIEATMFKYYEFRLLPDFGQGQAVVQDAYMNVHYWEPFQFEIGKFKQPFSYEQLIQDRFVPTLERSMIDQIVPGRDLGAMVHGEKLLGDQFDYAFSVSNGEINGNNTDTNNQKDLAGRIAWRPLNYPELAPFWRGLQLGVSGTTGIEGEPISPNALRTPATIRWLQFNPTVRADGVRNRYSPEVVYFWGPIGFAGQYMHQDQTLRAAPTGAGFGSQTNLPFEGGYLLFTCLLTGEERTTYSQAISPLSPWDPCRPLGAPGAWELVVRASRLRVGHDIFAPGAANLVDPTRYSSGARELTTGFNWYLNAWVRMQMNWEHAWFDEPVQLGSTTASLRKSTDSLITRFQIIF